MKIKFINANFEINTPETGSRLKLFRQSKNITLKELSKETGLSEGMISESENGKNKPSPNLMLALRKLYNMDINWLLTGEGEMLLRARQSMDSSNFQLVPVIGAAACGSSGRVMDEDIEGYKAFEISFIRKFKNPALTRAQGESMLPVIADKDLLLCDRDVNKRMRPDPKRMYLVNHPDGEEAAIKVKKLSFSRRTLTLIPLNPAFPPDAIDVTDKSILDIVLGEIVWIGRELKKDP